MDKRILVIDDNTDIRENTAEILDLAGYKTLTAENGKRGVEVATKDSEKYFDQSHKQRRKIF